MKLRFREKFLERFQLLATLKVFLYTFYNNFKSIAQTNDTVSSFDIITLLRIVVIEELTKFEIRPKTFYRPQNMVCLLGAHHW